MEYILGSSTSNGERQAPPPPPLPVGMSVVSQNSAGMQAPPPPPLPEGFHAIGATKQGSGMQAPPPPPLPNGMTAAPKQSAGIQAPPPPPLPMPIPMPIPVEVDTAPSQDPGIELPPPMPIQAEVETAASQSNRIQVDGRPKTSLADAMNESKQVIYEPPIPQKTSVAGINGGDLSEGDFCFARSGMDGLYYHACIDSIDDKGAEITFFDDSREYVIFEKMYTDEEIPKVMQCFANWNNKGSYYPAKVIDYPESAYTVVYDENPDIVDTLGRSWTRFAPW